MPSHERLAVLAAQHRTGDALKRVGRDFDAHAELALEERSPQRGREIVDALAARDDLQAQTAPPLEEASVGRGDVDVPHEAVFVTLDLARDDDRFAFDRREEFDAGDARGQHRALRHARLQRVDRGVADGQIAEEEVLRVIAMERRVASRA